MLKTLGGKLVNNIGLKLLALFLATVLWMVVVNTEDPIVRKSMTVSVFMKNQEYITDMGKYMDVLNESNIINVLSNSRRLRRRIIKKLNSSKKPGFVTWFF